MNTAILPFQDTRSLTEQVAEYFKAHPREWVSFHDLARIGGTGGWRSRVSDCRKLLGLNIENRYTRKGQYTQSFYRYVPE